VISHWAIISVGSNIKAEFNVLRALHLVERQFKLIDATAFIWTEPIGGDPNQPQYYNGAWLIESNLGKEGIMDALREIEDLMGRERRHDKFAPRIIDLDLVVWDGRIVHDDVFEREFLQNFILSLAPEMTFELNRNKK
jgi:2-amino-4-hydroxy-6-hydroxymethyldihydropteridine diphosphokinase